jgi:twitching motility protein PilT
MTHDKTGRVAAFEILVATPALRNLIREGKTHQIPSYIQTGHRYGMVAMDSYLADLVNKKDCGQGCGRRTLLRSPDL